MVSTSWTARLLPPQSSAPFLETLDRAFQAAGLARAPAAWFGTRGTPDFVLGQDVFERAAKQEDDRLTLAYAVGGGFGTTTAFLARLALESDAQRVSRLQVWTPMLDFNLAAGGAPELSALLARLAEAIERQFASGGDSPLVEAELLQTQLTADQVREWADAHVAQANLVHPRLDTLRLIPAGHRQAGAGQSAPPAGDVWVVRYASKGDDSTQMTVVHVEDRTGEIKLG